MSHPTPQPQGNGSSAPPRRRVVITGMGAVSPAGVGVAPLWQAVREGTSFGSVIRRFDPSRNASQIAATVPPFDPGRFGVTPDQSSDWDRVTLYSVVAAAEAVAQARLTDFDPHRAGVCIGTAIGGVEVMEMSFNTMVDPVPSLGPAPAYPPLKPIRVPSHMFTAYSCNTTSVEIAARWGLRGPVTCVSTGCTAGVDAIGYCLDLIRQGDAEVMVTGGADAAITPLCLTAFDVIRAITRRNHEPDRASRPFDSERSGFLMSEGAGMVVLEELEHARRRGATILGEVVGYGTNCNAHHMTGMHEDGQMLAVSIELALKDAGLTPDEIHYINAHGSSTPQNDRAETAAYKKVFGEAAYRIPISSTKSVTGHPLGAASALELIVSTLTIRESFIPPTANLYQPSEECDLDYVPLHGRSQRVRYVLSNASGFGGLHSAVVVGEVEP
jgi:beta-ketoacyl-acyl-carrier-protein synthase II